MLRTFSLPLVRQHSGVEFTEALACSTLVSDKKEKRLSKYKQNRSNDGTGSNSSVEYQ